LTTEAGTGAPETSGAGIAAAGCDCESGKNRGRQLSLGVGEPEPSPPECSALLPHMAHARMWGIAAERAARAKDRGGPQGCHGSSPLRVASHRPTRSPQWGPRSCMRGTFGSRRASSGRRTIKLSGVNTGRPKWVVRGWAAYPDLDRDVIAVYGPVRTRRRIRRAWSRRSFPEGGRGSRWRASCHEVS